jgi:hypothetical protein
MSQKKLSKLFQKISKLLKKIQNYSERFTIIQIYFKIIKHPSTKIVTKRQQKLFIESDHFVNHTYVDHFSLRICLNIPTA